MSCWVDDREQIWKRHYVNCRMSRSVFLLRSARVLVLGYCQWRIQAMDSSSNSNYNLAITYSHTHIKALWNMSTVVAFFCSLLTTFRSPGCLLRCFLAKPLLTTAQRHVHKPTDRIIVHVEDSVQKNKLNLSIKLHFIKHYPRAWMHFFL